MTASLKEAVKFPLMVTERLHDASPAESGCAKGTHVAEWLIRRWSSELVGVKVRLGPP